MERLGARRLDVRERELHLVAARCKPLRRARETAPFSFVKRALPTADNDSVSTTLSPSVRIFAVVGILAAAGLAGAFFLLGRTTPEAAPAAAATPPAPVSAPAERPAVLPTASREKPGQTAPQAPASGLPTAVDRALAHNRVAVVVVYVPGSRVDAFVRAEARAAAATMRAGHVAIRATNERLLRPLVAKTGVLPMPAVVVLRRGQAQATVLGVVDRELVAQAIVQARR